MTVGVMRMNPRGTCIEALSALGFVLKEHGGKHDKYFNSELKYTVTVKRSHFTEDDTRMILQEIKREKKR